MSDSLIDRVDLLCAEAERHLGGHVGIAAARTRLHEPLRVAVAGRVKAGKSTLVNGLVGERLAATDASECTRYITWYRHALSYDVNAILNDGTQRSLRFRRDPGAVTFDLEDVAGTAIDHVEIRWPATRLEDMTLIDTPGLGSARLADSPPQMEPAAADAVIYLMRHLHFRDVDFLEAFGDHELGPPSPTTAIAVLSRADEIGGGRTDALESARSIAARYTQDNQIRALCATVIPVAGLLAESAAGLREDEVAAMRSLLTMDSDGLATTLLSADRFTDPASTPLPSQTRLDLFDRLGMFGVRTSLDALARNRSLTATDLARMLRLVSGIDDLQALLDHHFRSRARALKANSAMTALRDAVRNPSAGDRSAAAGIDRAVEALWAEAEEFAEFRLWDLISSGSVAIDEDELADARRVAPGAAVLDRLGLEPDTDTSAARARALEGIQYWRDRTEHPLATRRDAEAFSIVVRWYEGIYAQLRDSV